MIPGTLQHIVQGVCYHLGMSEAEVCAMPADELARHVVFASKYAAPKHFG